jgi:RHS repeat-associated protein
VPLPGFDAQDRFVPSVDGATVDHFFTRGQHEFTRDALSGKPLITFNYDSLGANDEHLVGLTDDTGNTTTITRTAGKVVITAPFGQETTLNLDASGYVSSLVNPNGETVGFTYETTAGKENGLLKTLTDPKKQVHSFQYDPVGLLTEDDNPAGGQRKLARTGASATGWTVTHTTRMGYESTYAISTPVGGSWERDVTDPTGATSSYVEGGDGSETATWNDLTGNVLATTAVLLGPDPRYGMIAPIAASTTTTVQPSGLTRTTTHTRSATEGSSFLDAKTQTDLITVNPADAQPQTLTTTYTAGVSNNTLLLQTTNGRTVTATLDTDNRMVGLSIPGIAPAAFTYNTVACPGGGEGCGGRLTKVTATSPTDGTRTWTNHYRYSPDTGFSSSAVDALGQVVAWTRDPVGRPLHTQLPDLTSTTDGENQLHTTYDPNGNLSTVTVPSTASSAPTHAFPLYSQVDDLKTYAPPALSPPLATSNTSYTYNFDRQLTQIQVPDTATYQTVTAGYDPVGRLATVVDSKSGVTATYAYAPGGLPQSVTTSDGEVLTYGFGVDGAMLMSETWSGTVAGSVSFTHDDFLRVASRSVNGGAAVTYQFDADGLYAGTTGLVTSSITRDWNGKNGFLTGSTVGSVTDALTYDGFGEPKTYAATVGGAALYSATITARDADGRIKTATEMLSGTTHAWAFAYDAHGDLDSVTEDGATTAYVFDPNGNRLSAGGQSSTYDAQDRLLTSPGATYTYSNNGDLETKVTSAGTTKYAYDLRSSLRSVTLPTGDTVTYVIDGHGRRVGRTWTHGGQTVTQGYLYDSPLHVAAELDGSGNVVSTFVYGTRSNVPDAMVRGGNAYRIVSDWRGSVRAVVDAKAGTVVETIDYDAWGNATVNDTTCAAGAVCAAFQPFGFAGGMYDRETGLTRFGARDYDATSGRWTQKDRSGFGGGRNFYAYSWNDPVDYVDITGYEPWAIVTLVKGAGVALVKFVEQSAAMQHLMDSAALGQKGNVAAIDADAARQMGQDLSAACGGSGTVTNIEQHGPGAPHVHGEFTPDGPRVPGHIFVNPSLFEDLLDFIPGPWFVGPTPQLPGTYNPADGA